MDHRHGSLILVPRTCRNQYVPKLPAGTGALPSMLLYTFKVFCQLIVFNFELRSAGKEQAFPGHKASARLTDFDFSDLAADSDIADSSFVLIWTYRKVIFLAGFEALYYAGLLLAAFDCEYLRVFEVLILRHKNLISAGAFDLFPSDPD